MAARPRLFQGGKDWFEQPGCESQPGRPVDPVGQRRWRELWNPADLGVQCLQRGKQGQLPGHPDTGTQIFPVLGTPSDRTLRTYNKTTSLPQGASHRTEAQFKTPILMFFLL